MASASLHKAAAWLIAVIVALLALTAALSPARADIKSLQREIKELQDDVDEAREDEKEAERALADNQKAQKGANGAGLLRLKQEAIELAEEARQAREVRNEKVKAVAKKQSELRNEASETAADKVGAQGNAALLVADATEALKAWIAAVGEIPSVPTLRPTDGMDEDEARAVKDGDEKKLNNYIDWCDDEVSRLTIELQRADTVANNNLEGGKQLGKDAAALKKKLTSRQKSVETNRDSAKDRRDSLR